MRRVWVIDDTEVDEERGVHRIWHLCLDYYGSFIDETIRGVAVCGATPTDKSRGKVWHGATHERPGFPHDRHICKLCDQEYDRLMKGALDER